MTEQQLHDFQSDFDPQTLSESLKADPSPQNKARQFAILKTADFLVYAPAPGRVNVLNNAQKQAFLAAFTCREELDKWPFPKTDVAEMPFEALRRLVENGPNLDGIVINPFGKALNLNRTHLADIEQTLRAANPRKELQLKATLDYPIGLPLAVKTLMTDHPEVYRVWLLAARSEGDTAHRKLFVVDLDGQPDSLFPQLARAVRLYLRQGEQMEMVKADIRLLRAAEQTARPIYEKA